MKRIAIIFCFLAFNWVSTQAATMEERRILLGIVSQAHRCFSEATRVLFLQGNTDYDKVTQLTINYCGVGLGNFLAVNAKWDQKDIELLLRSFADDYFRVYSRNL